MRSSLFVLAFLGCWALPACGPPAESSALSEELDSVGMRIVENRRSRWIEEEAWSVSPDPWLIIGVLNGPEEYQLVDISAAAMRSDGGLVVLDRGAKTVRLFDADGTFERTVGGPGSGPGEFQNPSQVLVTPGDSMVVWDEALLRVTRFDAVGELIDARGVDLATIAKAVDPPLYPGMIELLPDGRFLVRLMEKKGKGTPSGLSRNRSGALSVSSDLSAIDTLMFFGDVQQITVEWPFGPIPVEAPVAERTWITHQGRPSKICIGAQEGPEIVCFGPGGEPTVLRWPSQPRPVTPSQMEAWRKEIVRLFELKLGEADVLRALEQVPVPAARPHHAGMTLDATGHLWVDLGPTPEGESPSHEFLVFDSAGWLLGTIEVPPLRVLEIGDDYLLGLYLDELEVEYLHVHSIRKPSDAEIGEAPS